MEIIETESFDCIKNICNEIAVNNLDKYIFYRGTKENYLVPSIVPFQNKLDNNHLAKIEEKLLKEFKIIYPGTISNADNVTINWLYRIKAREHELASRLIDWSNTFYIALDFASSNIKEENYDFVYLWILQIEQQELLFYEDLKNHAIEKIASSFIVINGIRYNFKNDLAVHRQSVQGGNFLVQPSHLITTPLNEQPIFSNKLTCLKITVSSIAKIRMDIINLADEDVDQSIMIEKENCIDSICKTLNNKLLYSVNNKIK